MLKNFILIRLAGGVGNQLFQFASAVNLAQRQTLPFSSIIIDTRFLESYDTKHKFEIGFISKLFPGVQVAPKLTHMAAMASRFRLAKILDKKLSMFDLISSVDHLKASSSRCNSTVTYILDGYFQHPDVLFTKEDRNMISANLLSAKSSLIEHVKNGLPTIGIHIRRGDYLTSKYASRVFHSIPLEYYHSALKQIKCDKNLLVFSDDREFSASFAAEIGGVDVRQLNLTLEDEFCLLMACDDYIIANSTFSWWAAYLGHKPGGRVIAPKYWYHNKTRSQNNPLLLPNFELIDA